MKPLCHPLHEALRYGAERANAAMHDQGLSDPEHSWLGCHLARVQAGMYLRRNQADIAPWKVLTGQRTGSLQLVWGQSKLRVLRPLDGGLPIPGRNRARQCYYIQETITDLPLQEALPELDVSRYVAVWDILDYGSFDVGIQVYRTVGTFNIGDSSKVDLAFWLPDEADGIDEMSFEPSDDGIELPIPQEEADDDTLHG